MREEINKYALLVLYEITGLFYVHRTAITLDCLTLLYLYAFDNVITQVSLELSFEYHIDGFGHRSVLYSN